MLQDERRFDPMSLSSGESSVTRLPEERRQSQLKLINEIGRKVLSTLELEKLYGEVIHTIQTKYNYYQLSLWTFDPAKDELVLRAQSGYREHPLPEGYRVPITKGIIGWTARNLKIRLVKDVTEDPYYFNPSYLDTKSELTAPIESKGKLLGVLNIESNEPNAFDETDATVMETIAGQFAIAILNAELYHEVKSFNEVLSRKVREKTYELQQAHQKILEQQRLLKKENQALKTILTTQQKGSQYEIIGKSEEISSLLSMVDKIAPTTATVLIQGESGTGKELIARRLHIASSRADKPFVAINCGTLTESLLASELFGHEKGSFTGAHSRKIGLVESADGGTLFLDEIGEMGLSVQAKLLRFLQEGEIYRVGGKTPLRVNVRILSATNKDLDKAVQENAFREDLIYRLNMITLRVAPLRKRKEDIPLLVEYFLKDPRAGDKPFKKIAPNAMALLLQYHWPGNIRELQNVVERIKILVDGELVSAEDILAYMKFPTSTVDTALGSLQPMILSQLEKMMILRALTQTKGNKTRAAKLLGITIKTLYNKLHKYSAEGEIT